MKKSAKKFDLYGDFLESQDADRQFTPPQVKQDRALRVSHWVAGKGATVLARTTEMKFTEPTAIKGFEIAAGPPGRSAISLANGHFEQILGTPRKCSYFSRKTLAIYVVILKDGIATFWGRH